MRRLALLALGACLLAPEGLAAVDSEGSQCAGADNATTVRELGLELLEGALGRRPKAWKETRLAEIWKGYGEVTRLQLTLDGEGPSEVSLIVKRFVPSSANITNASEHDRFMGSVLVELAAYRELSPLLAEAGIRAPRPLHAPSAGHGEPATLVMEDLSESFPRGAEGKLRQMTWDEIRSGMRWLARFHALFWEAPRAAERGLWSRGTYWHLDKWGREELGSVPETFSNRYISNEDWRRLRAAADAIDARLAGRLAAAGASPGGPLGTGVPFQTLLHGDAKPANILCSAAWGAPDVECAALDFSWVGAGYGMYDVMYLLWGEFTQQDVDRALQEYHSALVAHLPRGGPEYTMQVLRRHFDLCVVDFMRWWAGFRNGEHFWAMPWALDIFHDVMDRLDGGALTAPPDYAEAVEREFPFP